MNPIKTNNVNQQRVKFFFLLPSHSVDKRHRLRTCETELSRVSDVSRFRRMLVKVAPVLVHDVKDQS